MTAFARKPVVVISCVAGVLLLTINVFGLFVPLRHPNLAAQRETEVHHRRLLSQAEFDERIRAHPGSDFAYATNLTQAVHEGLYHLRPNLEYPEHSWKLPIYENYLLWASRYLLAIIRSVHPSSKSSTTPPRAALIYEFSSAERAMRRGVGMCTQHAIVAMALLQRAGIDTREIGMACSDGTAHAVLEATFGDHTPARWILDPDYGVVFPLSIDAIRNDPEQVRPHYAAAGYDDARINTLVRIYREGTYLSLPTVRDAHGRVRYAIEFFSYYLIWIVPAVLIAPCAVGLFRRRSTSHRAAGHP